jgi:hypothetical protein
MLRGCIKTAPWLPDALVREQSRQPVAAYKVGITSIARLSGLYEAIGLMFLYSLLESNVSLVRFRGISHLSVSIICLSGEYVPSAYSL